MLKSFFSKLFGVKSKKETNAKNRIVDNAKFKKQDTFDVEYQKITAKDIALQNNIEYIPDAIGEDLFVNNEYVNSFYAGEGKYILLYPANDGKPTCPFEWYGTFDGKAKMIINNHSSFKEITNISEILLQMVNLYSKYIDEDIFISFTGFAIKLEEEVTPNYHGRASLVLTKNSILNKNIKPDKIIKAKKYFINGFLDHYIGWNFGVTVTSNPELEKALIDFNNLVIEKGLRKYAGDGLSVWSSEDVMHYSFKKK